VKVTATTRSAQGTSASRRLRRADKVPGIIYGGKAQPTAIEVEHNPMFHALRKEKFHASILEMDLDGKSERVLLRDFQMHPYKPQVLHMWPRTRRSTCACRCTSSARKTRRRSS